MALTDQEIKNEVLLVLEGYDKFGGESISQIVMNKLDISAIRFHRVSKQVIQHLREKVKVLEDFTPKNGPKSSS